MFITNVKRNRCKFKGGCKNYPKIGSGGFCELHEKEDPGYLRKKTEAMAHRHQPDPELYNFYLDAIREINHNPVCMECGAPIEVWDYGNAIAHVLRKSAKFGFPSVRAHPENKLFLGPCCGCHDKFDSSWDNAEKMNVWGLAVEKFLIIYPAISRTEQRRIPPQLLRFVEDATR